jgi:hypothetical protein
MSDLIITAFGGKIFGVERATGAQRWRVQLSEYTTAAVELFITDERVVALSGAWLGIIERRTGRLLRKVERKDGAVGSRPVVLVEGAHLFVGGLGALACYTLEGDFVWEQPFKGEGTAEVSIGVPGNVRQADDRR